MFLVTVHLLINADSAADANDAVLSTFSTIDEEKIADWSLATMANPTAPYPKYLQVPFRQMYIPDEYAYAGGFIDLMYGNTPNP